MTLTVLVTGVGGPAGINVVDALHHLGHRVVGVDCDPAAAGFHIADRTELVPRASAPGAWTTHVLGLLGAHDVDVVIATVVEELLLLDRHRDELAALGVGYWAPYAGAVERCADKLLFHETLRDAGVATPATHPSGRGVPGPWIVKPRRGRGSRGVHAVDTRKARRAACRLTEDAIVQTRVPGREFSADVLVDAGGTVLGGATRWRDACRGGISVGGTTFVDPAVDAAVARTARAVGLAGPANVQGFVQPDGAVSIVEVNPRFSGGLPLSIEAGADLVGQYLVGALGGLVDRSRLVARPGVTMTRVFREHYSEPGAPATRVRP